MALKCEELQRGSEHRTTESPEARLRSHFLQEVTRYPLQGKKKKMEKGFSREKELDEHES